MPDDQGFGFQTVLSSACFCFRALFSSLISFRFLRQLSPSSLLFQIVFIRDFRVKIPLARVFL